MLKSLSGFRDPRIMVGFTLLLAIIITLFVVSSWSFERDQPRRPELMVMTSIPLQWGDATMAQIANGEAEPSPLFGAISAANTVKLIDDVMQLGEPGKVPLLMIQPRAFAPVELVQLDAWVRNGGRVIIFADPALDWPNELSLGDQRRPLFTSLLNPLFRHWGVELALPVGENEGIVEAEIAGYSLSLKSPGIWVLPPKTKATARCAIRTDELLALCRVGRGQALLVADADVLHDAQWTDSVLTSGTIVWLNAIINASRSGNPFPDKLWEIQGK